MGVFSVFGPEHVTFAHVTCFFISANGTIGSGASFGKKKFSVKLNPGSHFGPKRSKIPAFGQEHVTFAHVTCFFVSENDTIGSGASYDEKNVRQIDPPTAFCHTKVKNSVIFQFFVRKIWLLPMPHVFFILANHIIDSGASLGENFWSN